MRILLTVVLILFLFVAPVSAYTFTHQLEANFDGAWDMETTYTDGVVMSSVSLSGEGIAQIYSLMEISPVSEADMLWWNLF